MTDKTANTQTDSKQAIPSPEDRVRAIREREQKATKGPYTLNGGNYLGIIAMVDGKSSQIGRAEGCGNRLSDEQVEDNARFFAHARADIPYLLSLVEELKGQVAAKEKERGQWQALFMESEEYNCSCNIADTAKPVGDPMNYVCDWHERHPDITKARNETFPLAARLSEPSAPQTSADPGFTKGYKYHGYADEPVSDACGDGKHSECTFDLTKCHCKYRAGHNTMHSYVFKSGRAASQEGTE